MTEKLRQWSQEVEVFLFCFLASIPPTTLICIFVLIKFKTLLPLKWVGEK